MADGDLKSVEKILKVEFKNKTLLRTSLTHSSFAYENNLEFNEKLEFLGDAVLGLVVTEFIFLRYPEFEEGDLAKLRANLVRAETLAITASKLGVGEMVLISKGAEQAGGRTNESILSDCLEAIIGAIYLDRGYEIAKVFVLENLQEIIFTEASRKVFSDPKTTLQELTMQRWNILPEYRIVAREGTAHNPRFSVKVLIGGKSYGTGIGRSKKKAEQLAAEKAIDKIT